jgi:hypothetical protein
MTIRPMLLMGALLGLLLRPAPGPAVVSNLASPGPGSAVSPRLHGDPGGPLYVIWKYAPDPQSGQIFFTRSLDGGQSWPPDAHGLDQDSPSGARSSSPRLASDGKGHVYAVWWTKQRDGKKDVLVRTSQDFGASFGPPMKLNQQYGAFPPEISADGQGHVYVVWADERTEGGTERPRSRSTGHRLYLNRSADHGATWLPEDVKLSSEMASGGRVMQAWPQIRSDAQGHVYVVWFDTRDSGGSIYFRASDDFGRTWREERRLKGAGGDVEGPMQLAATDQGHLYVAWADNREGEYGIYLVASTDHGRTWTEGVRLDVAKAKGARASLPALAADAAGRVYVAWQDARHGGWDIYLNRSADFGKTWRPEGLRLNTGPAGEAEAQLPQLAVDDAGTVAVTWQEDRGNDQREGIYLTWSTDFGQTWLPSDLRVDDPVVGGVAVKPQIAMRPNAAVVLAWEIQRPERQTLAVTVVAPSARQTPTR